MKLSLWFLLLLPLLADEPIRYELRFPNAAHHEAEVKVTFSGVRQPVLQVVMSRSSPGRYALHEFGKNVYNLRASDGHGHPLEVTRANPYQWNIVGHKGAVVVEYTLYGDRTDGTYSAIDSTHAHLNLPATLLWAHGMEKLPVSLKFDIPEGSNWKIATQLQPRGDGTWAAPNLDRMMDSPVELSAHTLEEWKVGEAQFRIALHHRGTEQEAAAFGKMCEAVTVESEGVFGRFPQYDNGTYTFLLDYLPYANGDGMEHRNSTVISGPRDLKGAAGRMIGTVSHEFFHSWNVKRIRPKALEPFDFERANMSGELWFAEGFSSYYGPLILRRAGLTSIDGFTRAMNMPVNAVLTAPGRQVFNVIDMSRQAPFVDAATANDPVNTANTFISYYTYGDALGLGIDLAIRSRFPGKSLDDWMRAMWRAHPDAQKPYTLQDLERALGEVTSMEFAREIFDRHIRGMDSMDYEALLSRAGLLLRKASSPKTFVGQNVLDFTAQGAVIDGASLRGSPLYNAGLDRGDRILEWEGKALKTAQELDTWLDQQTPGSRVKLKVETRGGRKDIEVELSAPAGFELKPYEQAGRELTLDMKAFRDSWLGSKAVHPLPALRKHCPVCKRTHVFEYENCPYDGATLLITPGNAPPRAVESRRPRR